MRRGSFAAGAAQSLPTVVLRSAAGLPRRSRRPSRRVARRVPHLLDFEHEVVLGAVQPVLSGLERLHDRVAGLVSVPRGVLARARSHSSRCGRTRCSAAGASSGRPSPGTPCSRRRSARRRGRSGRGVRTRRSWRVSSGSLFGPAGADPGRVPPGPGGPGRVGRVEEGEERRLGVVRRAHVVVVQDELTQRGVPAGRPRARGRRSRSRAASGA